MSSLARLCASFLPKPESMTLMSWWSLVASSRHEAVAFLPDKGPHTHTLRHAENNACASTLFSSRAQQIASRIEAALMPFDPSVLKSEGSAGRKASTSSTVSPAETRLAVLSGGWLTTGMPASSLIQKDRDKRISHDLLQLATGLPALNRLPWRSSPQQNGELLSLNQDYLLIRDGRVAVQAFAASGVDTLHQDLTSLGLIQSSVHNQTVSGFLPISALNQVNKMQSLALIRPVFKPQTTSFLATPADPQLRTTLTGNVNSQGDRAQRSDLARTSYLVDGSGVTIGVLSDSYNSLGGETVDIATGDLPAGVNILQDIQDGSDEGRAMLQLVHDIAPGASLAFRTAFISAVDFASGILQLARPRAEGGAGANIIVDDVTYLAEPYFQDGIIAQAVDQVTSSGAVSYFSSAGNSSARSYESIYSPSTIGLGDFSDWQFHDFDPGSNVDIFQDIELSDGESFIPFLQWDEPFASASTTGLGCSNDVDIFIFRDPSLLSGSLVASSTSGNVGNDPLEYTGVQVKGGPATVYFAIGQYLPSGGNTPTRLKYIDRGAGATLEYPTNSSTSFGHAIAQGGQGVAATFYARTPAYGQVPPLPEPFTSLGGATILFDKAGNRLASPETRNQPGITAPDGVSTTVPGFEAFFGTSAAAPSAAAAAALILQKVPTASNKQIYEALQKTALDMSTPGFDPLTGAGLIQIDRAIESLVDDGDAVFNLNTNAALGTTLIASLTAPDPDGNGSGGFFYSWERSNDGTNWLAISGAISSSYKINPDDEGKQLRLKITYKDAQNFNETLIVNAGTVLGPPPRVIGITIEGSQAILQFSKAIDISGLLASRFAATVGGLTLTRAVSAIATVPGEATKLSLTIAGAVPGSTQAVTVSYTDPNPSINDVTGVVQDLFGIDMADISPGRVAETFSSGANVTSLADAYSNIILTGSTAINASGNGLANTITGNTAINVINGGLGDDTLNGGGSGDVYLISTPNERTTGEIRDDGSSGIDELRFTSATAGQTLLLFADDTGLERAIIGTGNTSAAASTAATTTLNLDASAAANGLTIIGNNGANTLIGTAFADSIQGNAGNDSILGGDGNDTLNGGLGIDTLSGGFGADLFRFDAAPNAISNRDLLTDFVSGSDKLSFSRAVYAGFNSTDTTITSSQFSSGAGVTTATSTTERFLYNTTTGDLYFDRDGSATSFAAIQVAVLGTNTALDIGDFVLTA